MAYSKAKLKSSGERASPCFKLFLIGNLSDTFLPTWTLLYVSDRHVFISLISFLGIPNSMRILYKTSLLTKSCITHIKNSVFKNQSVALVVGMHVNTHIWTGCNCLWILRYLWCKRKLILIVLTEYSTTGVKHVEECSKLVLSKFILFMCNMFIFNQLQF
jgi:hypothetical protein